MDADLRFVESLVRDRVPEGVSLDYKSTLDLDAPAARKELAKDLSAFANEIGGAIVVGVPTVPDARGNPEVPSGAPPGIAPIPGVVERIQDIAADLVRPRIPRWSIEPLDVGSGQVVYVARIAQSMSGPHMMDGRFYHRSGHRSHPMEEHLVRQRYFELLGRRVEVEGFLQSNDIRIFEGGLQRSINLRVALVPGLNVRGLDELDQSARQTLQVATRSPHPARITWFGAEMGHQTHDEWWRFYDSGAVVGWKEAEPWSASPDGRAHPQSQQELMVVPVAGMMIWTGRVLIAARRFYELAGVTPPSLRFSLRWFGNLPNPHVADLFAGSGLFLSDAPRVSRVEGQWISAHADCATEDLADPMGMLSEVLTVLGRHVGVTDAASYLARANDGASIQLRVGRHSAQVWPPAY